MPYRPAECKRDACESSSPICPKWRFRLHRGFFSLESLLFWWVRELVPSIPLPFYPRFPLFACKPPPTVYNRCSEALAGLSRTPYFAFTRSIQTPAAMVIPMSLMANLASCGNSETFSITRGLVGTTLTVAASPFLMNFG